MTSRSSSVRRHAVPPEDNPDDLLRGESEAELQFGRARLRLRGRHLMLIHLMLVLIVIAQAISFFTIYIHREDVNKSDAQLSQTLQESVGKLIKAQENSTKAQIETTWIVLQSDAEKARIRSRLDMPDSLRSRLRYSGP